MKRKSKERFKNIANFVELRKTGSKFAKLCKIWPKFVHLRKMKQISKNHAKVEHNPRIHVKMDQKTNKTCKNKVNFAESRKIKAKY